MKKVLALSIIIAFMLVFPAMAQKQDNLLINPSLEAPYTERKDRVIIAHGWDWDYWDRYMPPVSDGGNSYPLIQPEYKESPKSLDPIRVIDGNSAQCWFWAFAIGDAVIYQTVDVEPGRCYQGGASASSWVSNKEDTHIDGEMYFNIGLSPEAETVAWKTGVIWAPYQWSGWEYRDIQSRVVRATGPRMTMFLRATSKWKLRHNDAYYDNAWLREVPCSDTPIEPTPTLPPTATPAPTVTPAPQPTVTPQPGECVSAEQLISILLDLISRIKIEVG